MRLILSILGIISTLFLNAQCKDFSLDELESMTSMKFNEFIKYTFLNRFQGTHWSGEDKSILESYCEQDKPFKITRLMLIPNSKGSALSINKLSNAYIQRLTNRMIAKGYKKQENIEVYEVYEDLNFTLFIDRQSSTIILRNNNANTANAVFNSFSNKIFSWRREGNKIIVDSYTNTTDIYITKGTKIHFRASGNISFGPWAGTGSPDGIEGHKNYNRIAGFKHGSLLYRIGDDSEWKNVGIENTIISNSTGVLQLLVNDSDPSNNSGSFTVEYKIGN